MSSMVAQHLDAAALFRLGMASKDSRKCVHQSEVLYACVLRTFPGITGVPKGMGSGYYAEAFARYFHHDHDGNPYLAVVTLIGICIKDDADEDLLDFGETATPMGPRISAFLKETEYLFRSSFGRKIIMKCVRDWKATYVDDDSFSCRDDAWKILNRIIKIAKRKFVWEDRREFGRVGI